MTDGLPAVVVQVIIAGAGGAAHLPGMVAALTPLPVIGVPIRTSTLNGVDSLHSIVQMPKGIPVATVAIGEQWYSSSRTHWFDRFVSRRRAGGEVQSNCVCHSRPHTDWMGTNQCAIHRECGECGSPGGAYPGSHQPGYPRQDPRVHGRAGGHRDTEGGETGEEGLERLPAQLHRPLMVLMGVKLKDFLVGVDVIKG